MLHIHPGRGRKIGIKNPIILGESISGKAGSKIFVLDVNVLPDDRVLINLEMQVVNYQNWPERPLIYLCRNLAICKADRIPWTLNLQSLSGSWTLHRFRNIRSSTPRTS